MGMIEGVILEATNLRKADVFGLAGLCLSLNEVDHYFGGTGSSSRGPWVQLTVIFAFPLLCLITVTQF